MYIQCTSILSQGAAVDFFMGIECCSVETARGQIFFTTSIHIPIQNSLQLM